MFKYVSNCLIALFLLLILPFAYAQTIKVAAFDYPPYVYTAGKSPDDKVAGIITQILAAVSAETEINFVIHIYPDWAKALNAVIEGKMDAIIGYRTKEREQYLIYAEEPLFKQRIALFVKKNSPIKYSGNLRSLEDYKFGLVEKMSYGQQFDNAVTNHVIKRTEYRKTLEEINQDLLNGKVDVVAASLFDQMAMLNKMRVRDEIKVLTTQVGNVPTYIAFSLNDQQARAQAEMVNQAIRNMRADGRYQKLIKDLESKYAEELDIHAALGLYWLLKIL